MLLLRTLGGLSLLDAGTRQLIGAPRRKPLAILALVAEGSERGVERDWVASMLWPELPGPRARHALAQALYLLRRETGTNLFRAGPRLALDPARIAVDATELDALARPGNSVRELERAVSLYAGPYLDGVYFDRCADLESWIDGVRAAHARSYHGALRELAARAAESGDLRQAIAWLERAARNFPLDSGTACALADAYVAAGRSGQADAHLRAHLAVVEAELGQAPPAQLRELSRRVQMASMAPLAVAAPPLPLPAPVTARPRWSWCAAILGAGVASLALAGSMTWMLLQRPPESLSEALAQQLQPRPRVSTAHRGSIVLRIRPAATGDATVDSIADAALERAARQVRHIEGPAVLPADSVATLESRVREQWRGRIPLGEAQETYEMLRIGDLHAAIAVDALWDGDSLRFQLVMSRRAKFRDSRLERPADGRGMPIVRFDGPPRDGLETVTFPSITLTLEQARHDARAIAHPMSQALASLRSCKPELRADPNTLPWCWTADGELQVVRGFERHRTRRWSISTTRPPTAYVTASKD